MNEDKNIVKKSKRSFSRFSKEGMLFAVVLVVGLIVILSAKDQITVDLEEYDIAEFANVSYILGNMVLFYENDTIVTEYPGLIDPGFYPSLNNFEFEYEIQHFHNYLEIFRKYINQENVEDNLTFITLEDQEYEYQISYEVENQEYILYFSQYGSVITAELHFNNNVFEFEGSLSEQEEETAFDLSYSQGEFIAVVSPSDFLAKEDESVYLIDTWIDNNLIQIRITLQQNQFGIDLLIEDEENTYTISKGSDLYFVDYTVSGQIGTIEIKANTDTSGTFYNYTIVENSEEIMVQMKDKE